MNETQGWLLRVLKTRPDIPFSISELVDLFQAEEGDSTETNQRTLMHRRQDLHKKLLYHMRVLVQQKHVHEYNKNQTYTFVAAEKAATGTEKITLKLSAFVSIYECESTLKEALQCLHCPVHISDAHELLVTKDYAVGMLQRLIEHTSDETVFILHFDLSNTVHKVLIEFLNLILCNKVRAVLHVRAKQLVTHHRTLVEVTNLKTNQYLTITLEKA